MRCRRIESKLAVEVRPHVFDVRKERMERIAEDVGFYTVGYEGRIVKDFVEELVRSGVEILVDVREMPMSRKPGFSKSKLASHVYAVGIEYVHIRSLGSPRDSRRRLKESGDFESFSREYADHLEGNAEDVDSLLALILDGRRVALMCFERDHSRCHRNLLAHELRDVAAGDLQVFHL